MTKKKTEAEHMLEGAFNQFDEATCTLVMLSTFDLTKVTMERIHVSVKMTDIILDLLLECQSEERQRKAKKRKTTNV